MECPHLEENVNNIVQILQDQKHEKSINSWQCSVCKSNKSPWVCLTCGLIRCGRFVNGHSKEHYKCTSPQHSVCMDCDNWAVFCYHCDEFAVNDTALGMIGDIRQFFSDDQSSGDIPVKENGVDSFAPPKKRLKLARCSDDKSTVKSKATGLRNLGNTCFMNAVLQSLSNVKQFHSYIRQLPSLEHKLSQKVQTRNVREKDEIYVVEEVRKTILALLQSGKGAYSPDALFSAIWKVVPRFRGYQQQDAHEFMRYLLDRLHTELIAILPYPETDTEFISPTSKSSIVTQIFGGLLQSEVHCLVCGSTSTKIDPFLDLSLDIPSKFTKNTDAGGNECTLTDCLTSFTALEELEESEQYLCPDCQQRRASTKRFSIKKLPKVLCLHLKRFRWGKYQRVKVDTYVKFPLRELDVSNFVINNQGTRPSGSCCYDLSAVIVHHGSGAGSGHYTSFALQDSQWHHFNDSKVTLCDENNVLSSKAYILFYVKREPVKQNGISS